MQANLNYDYIKEQKYINLILADARQQKILAIDTETTGLDIFNSKLLLLQIAVNDNIYVIDARKVNITPLKEILESKEYLKVAQNCVPTSTKALTKRGWKNYNEIVVGDDVIGYDKINKTNKWCKVTHVFSPKLMRMISFGNSRIRFTTSYNHKWVNESYNYYTNKYDNTDITTNNIINKEETRVRLSAYCDDGGGSPITTKEASIIGWLLSDGHVKWSKFTGARNQCGGKRRYVNAFISQSKEPQRTQIELLVKDEISYIYIMKAKKTTHKDCTKFFLKPQFIRELWDKANLHNICLDEFVLSLSKESRKAFFDAVYQAEGSEQDGHKSVAQKKGTEKAAAFELAAFLEGYFPQFYSNSFGLNRAILSGQHLQTFKESEQLGWCIETTLGSWVAKDKDGKIYLTGNSKFDWKVLFKHRNINIKNIFDTQLAEALIQTGAAKRETNLGYLVKNYCNVSLDKETVQEFIDFPDESEFTDKQIEYAANDVRYLLTIKKRQEEFLKEHALRKIAQLEFSLIEPVSMMELKGIILDDERWTISLNEVNNKLFTIKADLRQVLPDPPPELPKPIRYKKDGTPFKKDLERVEKPLPILNIDSWQQMVVSMNKIGIDLTKVNEKTKAGKTNVRTLKMASIIYGYDTDKATLLKNYMRYKVLNHTVKSFGENLISWIQEDGRIHAEFNQDGTNSGRFSCSNPNLENIQKKGNEGRILRSCFVPPRNYKFIITDYSQIELRIAAEMSGDENMLDILCDPRGDVHRLTAATMFGIPYELVTREQRDAAKTLNFGIIFGMTVRTLQERIGCEYVDAVVHMQNYRNAYPILLEWIEGMGQKALNQGHADTLGGRIRWFPVQTDFTEQQKGFYARVGRNMPIQGCLPPDTRVLTPNGWLLIGDFNNGLIWTGEKWANAIKVNRGFAKRLKLYLSDGRTFDCDNRHYLLINDSVYPRWESIDNIVDKPLVRDVCSEWGNPIYAVEDWYWVGRMIGDGYLSNYGWGCAFGSHEKDDYTKLMRWLDSKDIKGLTNSYKGYNIEYDVRKNVKIRGCTKKGKQLWESFGLVIGKGARDKRIPQIVFMLDKIRRQAFVDGYIDSDGHKRKYGSKITSVNRVLLEDTLRLLQTLGVTGKISKPMKNNSGSIWYDLTIHKSPHKLTVERIEELGNEEMFTLSVDDDKHSFSSEGLISKNTSADMTKTAIAILYEPLLKYNSYVLNCIHDELLIESPIEYAIDVAKTVKKKMIVAGEKYLKKVPVLVEVKIRDQWWKDDGISDDENGQQLWLMPPEWLASAYEEAVDSNDVDWEAKKAANL
jgi:DNA polymerase I-like protein with 3'-5' exonuclease and polymerase domains